MEAVDAVADLETLFEADREISFGSMPGATHSNTECNVFAGTSKMLTVVNIQPTTQMAGSHRLLPGANDE